MDKRQGYYRRVRWSCRPVATKMAVFGYETPTDKLEKKAGYLFTRSQKLRKNFGSL